MFSMRFDLRAPQPGVSAADLYSAALDMCAWAERRGCASAVLSEHHGSVDGYLPSPLPLASAIAARTTRLPIYVSAVLVNLYDPVKLAEDMIVLDVLSRGRVAYVVGLGYRPEEYEMFGVDFTRRGAIMDGKIDALCAAVTGEPFEYQGRELRITPAPYTRGGPKIMYGGHTLAAARRAGRFGLDLMAEGPVDGLEETYRAAAESAGRTPGACVQPASQSATSLFVAHDVDAAWETIGPFMLHDAAMYAAWMGDGHDTVSKSVASSVDELRAEQGAYRIVCPEEAIAMVRSGERLKLHPLCGGLPPAVAWESLRLVGDVVMPTLSLDRP